MLDLVEEVHYDRKVVDIITLSDVFFDPSLLYQPGALDKIILGLATQARQTFDNLFTEQAQWITLEFGGLLLYDLLAK